MRLKENFFDSDALVLLESMPDGILYSNILIKMYLKSLKNEGKLIFNDFIPYNPQMIATVTRHQIGTVEKALGIFEQLGLIDVLSNGAIYMNDIELFIGKTSTEGDRKKKARIAIEKEKRTICGHLSDIRPPEIEKEIEKEINIEKEAKKDSIPYKEVIEYLNLKTSKNYKSSSKKTKDLIKARFNDGFTFEDFKKVIDIKVSHWLGNEEWDQYLRPQTLFGTKFEDYLNQKERKVSHGNTKQPTRTEEQLKELWNDRAITSDEDIDNLPF